MTTTQPQQPRPDPRIYDAPPLILTRTADGRYIPVIEPWAPERETAREAFARIVIIAHLTVEARKEREATTQREQEVLAAQKETAVPTKATAVS